MEKISSLPRKQLLDELKVAFLEVNIDLMRSHNSLYPQQEDLRWLLDEKLVLNLNQRLSSAGGKIKYLSKYKGKFYDYKDRTKIVYIELNPRLTLRSRMGVMKHEALHFLSDLSDNEDFRWLCRKLDIPAHHNQKFENREKYKYFIECLGCGHQYKRKRMCKLVKKIDSYRCHQCGSKLKKND